VTTIESTRPSRESLLNRISAQVSLRSYSLLLIVGVIWVGLQAITGGTFLSSRNLGLLALQTSITGITAVGAVLLIINRNFDLSVGSVLELICCVMASLMIKFGWGPLPTVAVALAMGLAIGAWQGWWVSSLGIPSFIVSLAGMLYFRGIALILAHGETVAPTPKSLGYLSSAWLGIVPSVVLIWAGLMVLALYSAYRARRAHALGLIPKVTPVVLRSVLPVMLFGIAGTYVATFRGIPYLVLLMGAMGVAGHILLTMTRLGQQILAAGSNPDAARLAGIQPAKITFRVWLLEGVVYGVAATALVTRVAGYVPGSGFYMELDAIASAVIGGTALAGGSGTVLGGLLGALLMKSLDNAMSLINLQTWHQFVGKGLVLLLAILVDTLSRKSSR
jgi:ABC-type xylose transport system permease subunit